MRLTLSPITLMTDEQQDYRADRIYDKRCIDFWCDTIMESQVMEELKTGEWDSERYYRELNKKIYGNKIL